MAELSRLIVDYRSGELVVRCLYRTQDGPGPSTKARTREVTGLVRSGLEQALEAHVAGDVADLGTSGFTTREDTILCINEGDEATNVHKKRVPTTKGAR
jgi:hypothetical protein